MGVGIHFASIIAMFLAANHDISHLILGRNKLRDEGIELIAKYLVSNKSIIHLDVSQNELSHKGAEILFECLAQNESIMSLDFGSYDGQSRNRIGIKGLKKLEQILLMPNTMLSHIYLAGNYIGNSGLQILANGLRNNERVMALDLTNNEISGLQGAEPLLQILTNQNNQIKRLVLSKNPIGNKGIEKFSKALRSEKCKLYYLNLACCEFNH